MDNELYHHGVKGMKWGVRRYQRKDGTYTPAGMKRRKSQDDWSDDAKTAYDIKQKSVKQMSNAELKKLNERTRLEQEYSRLNPNTVQKGWKYAAAGAAALGTVAGLYNNSQTLIKAGKKIATSFGGE